MSSIEISPARPEDSAFIAQAQIKMAKETEDLELDPPTVEAGVQAVFDDPSKGQYWVARSGSKSVACLLTVPEWSDWRNGTVLWIHSVFVDPSMRGKGVYAQVYRKLQDVVRESEDLRGLRLYVDRSNERAQRVYEKLGMNADHYQLYEWML
jgi:GNAT superfamily N-acetyltransferase